MENPPQFGAGTLPRVPRRLSPLSPIVRIGRVAIGLIVLATATSATQGGQRGGHDFVADYVIIGIVVVGGLISWLVTTWQVDNDALQVQTGHRGAT